MKAIFALMWAATAANADSLQRADLAKLRDPALRDVEVSRLAECNGENYSLARYHFLTANQKNGGPPLHVLCAERHYESSSRAGMFGAYSLDEPEELFGNIAVSPGSRFLPELETIQDSVILVFDSSGKEVRPFGGNNYTNRGYYFDFDHDGILDRADSTHHSVNEAENDSIQVFELQSIEPVPRTLLQVIFNWHPKSAPDSNDWTFTCLDEDHDGFPEIAFAPESELPDQKPQRFVFKWDPATKRYSAGEILPHSHVRVLKPGETLASVAKAGALGYPLIKDRSDSPSEEPAATSSQAPYVFRSFKDQPSSEIAAFFAGRNRRDSFSAPEDSFPNRLPGNFMNLAPKQAAIALADANRTPTHRAQWRLALDDRANLTPPESGWLIHGASSSGCYSLSAQLFALRFGVADPSLIVFDYNSIGVVGRNPWADQPANGARVIKLTEKEARFLADTVFWLDRIRTYSPGKSDNLGMGYSSTADGYATTTLYSDGAAPRELGSETIWATSSISGQWNGEYTHQVFQNFAKFLITDGFPASLGERWKVAPEIDRQSLRNTAEERLEPRVDDDARQKLVDTFAAILQRNAQDPVPAVVLQRLVGAAGDEALSELLADLQKMLAALPAANAEDQEFATLEKRFATDHFGDPLEDKPAEHKKAYARLGELTEKRKFLASAILRDSLTASIAKLRLVGNPTALRGVVEQNDPDSNWALAQFHRLDPETWAELVAGKFENEDLENRRVIFETLTAGFPPAAGKLIANLTPAGRRDLVIEVARYHQKYETASAAEDFPLLMALIRDKDQDFIRRGEAMVLLSQSELPPTTLTALTTLLVAEIKHPQQGKYGMGTLDSAISALAALPGASDHLDSIASNRSAARNAYSAGFKALRIMSGGRPDQGKWLADFIRPRFVKCDGMMDQIFMDALAFDLRGLAADIATFASESPSVQDGDGTNYSGGNFKTPIGQRYHLAREITAIWSESDPVTLARMWIHFIAAHPHEFSPESEDPALRELAANQIRRLPSAQRRDEITAAIRMRSIPEDASQTRIWLSGLGQSE